MIAPHILTEAELASLRFGDFERASGLVICITCQRPYFDHPTPIEPNGGERWGWLRRLCDGRFIKP